MAANPNNIIIDASVAAKWYLIDEVDSEIARQIQYDFVGGKIQISVPVLICYELANLLKSTTKSLRIDPEKALQSYQAFLNSDLTIYNSTDTMNEILEKAFELDISAYDASYLVLAEFLQIPFYTSDQKLLSKVNHPLLKPLSDYLSWNEGT